MAYEFMCTVSACVFCGNMSVYLVEINFLCCAFKACTCKYLSLDNANANANDMLFDNLHISYQSSVNFNGYFLLD